MVHRCVVAAVLVLLGCQATGPTAGLYLHVVNESDAPARVVGLDDADGPGGNAPPGLLGACEAFTEAIRPGARTLAIFSSTAMTDLDLVVGPPTDTPPIRTIVIGPDGSIDTDAPARPVEQRPCPHR